MLHWGATAPQWTHSSWRDPEGSRRRRRTRPSLPVLLVIALMVSSGCGPGRGATSQSKVGVLPLTATVGPAGAALSFRGGTVTVPRGALPQPTTVHVRAADGVPSPPPGDVVHLSLIH